MKAVRVLLWLTLLCGATTPGEGVQADPPPAPVPSLAALDEARALLRSHQAGAALRRLRAEGGMSLAAPERTWLLAQLAPLVDGVAATRAEIAALPRSPLRAALWALLSDRAAPARDELHLLLRRSSDPWLELAQAHLLARLGEFHLSRRAAARAARSRRPFLRVEALLTEARAAVEEGALEEALASARAAGALTARDARPALLAAEILRRVGRLGEARRETLEGLRRAPRNEGAARRLAELVRDDHEAVDPALWATLDSAFEPTNPEAWGLRSARAEAEGRPADALADIDHALASGAHPIPLERRRRHLLAALGRYRELADALLAAVPATTRSRPDNLWGPRWSALEQSAAAAPGSQAPAPARLAFAQALIGLGALEDARHVLRALPDAQSAAVLARLEGHLAFEGALKREVEAGYRAGNLKQAPRSVDALLAEVARLAARHLAPDEAAALRAPQAGLRRVAMLGAWLDHRARSTAPLVAHFRAYGRYLVFGQRADQPCEAIVLSLAVLVESAPLTTRGQRHKHDFALGYDRVLRSFIDAQGGGLAGACLPDGLWLDADAALDSEHDVRSLLRRDPSLLEAARRMPLPRADGPEGPFALFDQGGVLVRLLAAYVARNPQGRWGSLGTLHAHENGHVIDIRRHLPLWNGLPATLSLLAREGLSFARFEAELERRAQLASVIDAPDPDLALAEMIEMLPAEEHEPEAHAAGYRNGLDRIVRHVWSRPDLYPQIDRSARVLPQLDRLSLEQLRRAARAVVD
jgi:hypothetical protein